MQAIVKQVVELSDDSRIELIDALWALEAENRLFAYQNGEIQTLGLNQVLAKYR